MSKVGGVTATLVSHGALVAAAPSVVQILVYIDRRGLKNVLANPFEASLSFFNLYGIGCWVTGLVLSVIGLFACWKSPSIRFCFWIAACSLVMHSALVQDTTITVIVVATWSAAMMFVQPPGGALLRGVLTVVAAVVYGWCRCKWLEATTISPMTLQG